MPRPRASKTAKAGKVIVSLASMRDKLLSRVAKLQGKIAEIDSVFSAAGVSFAAPAPAAKRGPGRPPKAAKRAGRKRTRGVFAISGDESVLAFIKKEGSPTTAQVNNHWTGEGRGGKANNTLTRLTQEKKLKRIKDKDVRGSRYAIA